MAAYVDTAPFWAGIRERRLVLQYCPAAGRFQHPPRPVSIYTGRRALEWREVTGRGFVYAAAVMHVKDRASWSYATIELDCGVRILARLLDCAPGSARIGMRVRLTWDRLEGDAIYPAFEIEESS